MKTTLKKPKFWLLAVPFLLALLCLPPCLSLALVHYSEAGRISGVNYLLAIGVTPSDDALGAAAYNGHTAVVRSLLAAGANPNATNDIDETALAYAAENGHIEVVKLMLAKGADPNWGCLEKSPLVCAYAEHYTEIVSLLKRAGVKDNRKQPCHEWHGYGARTPKTTPSAHSDAALNFPYLSPTKWELLASAPNSRDIDGMVCM